MFSSKMSETMSSNRMGLQLVISVLLSDLMQLRKGGRLPNIRVYYRVDSRRKRCKQKWRAYPGSKLKVTKEQSFRRERLRKVSLLQALQKIIHRL